MISKVLAMSTVLAIASAGIVPVSYHAPVAAVSSQSIVRHEQPHAIATPVAYHSAPVAVHAAPVAYHSAPASYAAHSAVSSQNIIRHDNRHATIATVAAAPVHYAAPARIAVAHAAPVLHAAPAQIIASHQEDYNAHPSYDFAYSVSDGHSGDNKSQHETRDGDVVHGEYSLVEADGSVRRVQYSADAHSGFNAVVSHSAPAHHSVPAPAIAHAPVQILAHH